MPFFVSQEGRPGTRERSPILTHDPWGEATPAKWTYKTIFRVGDQRIGQWSDEVSITVGG